MAVRHHADQIVMGNKSWVEANAEREQYGQPTHISPDSCLVAAMGEHWQPGCKEAVEAMVAHQIDLGLQTMLYVEHDRCFLRSDAIGTMRNQAYLRAINEGWEYICYIDNDAAPPPDALERMMLHHLPIVCPIIRFADGHDKLTISKLEANQGLAQGNVCVLSFVLFKTSVFFPWALGGFWGNAIGDDEGTHYMKLANAGHRPYIDTSVEVNVSRPPTYPLDMEMSARLPWLTQSSNNVTG